MACGCLFLFNLLGIGGNLGKVAITFAGNLWPNFFFSLSQEYDDFFELISSKYLSDTRYTASVQAAAARLLLSCSLTWIVRFEFHLLFFFSFKKNVKSYYVVSSI